MERTKQRVLFRNVKHGIMMSLTRIENKVDWDVIWINSLTQYVSIWIPWLDTGTTTRNYTWSCSHDVQWRCCPLGYTCSRHWEADLSIIVKHLHWQTKEFELDLAITDNNYFVNNHKLSTILTTLHIFTVINYWNNFII